MLEKGQIVYYARIVEEVGTYEILELRLRTVEETYFVGTDNKSKHAYLFGMNSLDESIFFDRQKALKTVKEAEKNKKEVSKETFYEEY